MGSRILSPFCPNCGSSDFYVHDKGWVGILRWLILSSRLVCRGCNTTWRRNHPEHFSKIKKKRKARPSLNALVSFKIHPFPQDMETKTLPELVKLVGDWQEQGDISICLDMSPVKALNSKALTNIMKVYKQLRDINGKLILGNLSEDIAQYLWSINLGYLIHSNQEIIP